MLYLRPLMKAVYLFLVALFFLLSGGSLAYAGNSHQGKGSYLTAHHAKSAAQANIQRNRPEHVVVGSAAAKQDQQLLITDENEDDNFSVRKHVALVKYSLIFAYTLVLSCLFSFFKARLPFCIHLSYLSSYKYIVHRALRI
jgi:hypothetical protein